ncbi:MAG: hypothetical protein HYZ87_02320 [Candidatus Omnitrophica bacterium]|nr:hypothetical protein [Candidatus Omnitrophota bacterium]
MWNKTRALAFFWIFVLFLFQNSLNLIFLPNFKLILIGVVFYALAEGAFFGAALGAVAGLLVDFFEIGVPGLHGLALGAVGVASGFTASKIFKDSFFNRWVLPAFMGLLTDLGLSAVYGWEWKTLAGSAVFTVLASPPLFYFLRRVSGVKAGSQRPW